MRLTRPGPPIGCHEAERVVHARREALSDRVRRTPPDPLDLPSLAARAAALPGRVAAVEAFWDGHTVQAGSCSWSRFSIPWTGEPLATVDRRPDGSPPGVAAFKAGRALVGLP
jgi:hypothetical protein